VGTEPLGTLGGRDLRQAEAVGDGPKLGEVARLVV
jgi:hypothetical protein